MILRTRFTFPIPHYGDEDGCFAIGGDLSIDRLLLAYSNGIFPWYSFRDQPEILWFCPMKRFVIFPDEIHVSHSMRTLMRKDRYSVGINEDFDGVIRACSKTNGRIRGRWCLVGREHHPGIIPPFIEQGFAASVEVWDNETDELVGGLYGVTIGKVFIGESMFSKVPSASKIALIFLARLSAGAWRQDDRLPAGNPASQVDGWQIYFLRGIYGNHE